MVAKATMRLVAVAVLLCAVCAQPGQGGGSDHGRGPPKNQDGAEVQRSPPPISENRQPKGGSMPPPNVDRSGKKADRMFLLQSNGFNVEVNAASSTPFFRFWSDANKIQMVKLNRMFQTATPSDLSSSAPLNPIRLAGAYTWAFSDASSTVDANSNTTDVQFTVTGTARDTGNDKQLPGLAFTCHLLSNANGTEMKFDVDLSGWDSSWWADGAQALAIGYKVSQVDSSKRDIANLTMSDIRIQKGANRPNRPNTMDESSDSTKKERVAMDFGNGNGFEIVSTATDTTGASISVTMTAINTPNGGTYVLNLYNKWGGTGFSHDPSLYTASTSGTVEDGAATTTTFDSAPPISVGEDTGMAPNLQMTPPPEGGGGSSGASSLRVQWIGMSALLAALLAWAARVC